MLALALLLQAAAAPPRTSAPGPPTPLSGITVTVTREPPKVAATWPEAGATVAPGTLVLKVVFGSAMSPTGWSYGPVPGAAFPRCLDRPRLLADGRTFVLLCVTTDSTTWGVRLNGGGPPTGGAAGGFVDLGGRALAPFDLSFSTSGERATASLEDAMKAASLADDQGPVMDRRDQSATASPPRG